MAEKTKDTKWGSLSTHLENIDNNTKAVADNIRTPNGKGKSDEEDEKKINQQQALSAAICGFLGGADGKDFKDVWSNKDKFKEFHNTIFDSSKKFVDLVDDFKFTDKDIDNFKNFFTNYLEEGENNPIIAAIKESTTDIAECIKNVFSIQDSSANNMLTDIVAVNFRQVLEALKDIKNNNKTNTQTNISSEPQKVEANIKTNLSDNTIQSLIKFLTDLSKE